jgi:chromatin remodeling complex protein RSC6
MDKYKILNQDEKTSEKVSEKLSTTNNENSEQQVNIEQTNPIIKLLEEAYLHFEKANEENKNGMGCLKKIHKILGKYTNIKNKIKTKKPTGFSESAVVPQELKILLKLQEDTLPRTKLTKKVYEYIEENNLKCPINKRILRVNDKLAGALRLTKEQVDAINKSDNQKDKDGLNSVSYTHLTLPTNVP